MPASPEGPCRLRALRGEPAEMAALQAVLEAAPRYYEAVTGGPAEAQSTFTALPPGRSYDDKRVYGLYAGDAMIGVADVVRGWNAPGKAIIGLLLLAEPWQRRGFRGTGEVRPASPPFVADAVVLERPLARGGAAG